MILSREASPPLRPFVTRVWATDAAPGDSHAAPGERVLPSGATHVVLRLGSEPLRLFSDASGRELCRLGPAVVGGARARPYFKDVSRPVPSVGVVLAPGAASLLFGAGANALAGRHTPLDALWGADAERLCDEVANVAGLPARLAILERRLRARLPEVRGLHPGLARALHGLSASAAVGPGSQSGAVARAASASGLSQRRFGELFRRAVGLAPKPWLRLRRFQSALRRAAADPESAWSDVALAAGYCDQPHFNREFREFSGLRPGDYRRLATGVEAQANHVPIARPGLPIPSRQGRPSG